MSSSLDVEQLLIDDLQILSTPLIGAKHREKLRQLVYEDANCIQTGYYIHNRVWCIIVI